MANEITKSDLKRFSECEVLVETGAENMRRGLLEIRDKKLYRGQYKTFEEYCKTRWNISRQHANRMIDHAKVQESLTPNGCQINERQARELGKVEPEKRQEVLEKAGENGKPTAAKIKQAAAEVVEPEEEEELVEATPEERMKAWNSEVESFCRGLLKYAKDNVPSGNWMDESRQNIALDQVKSAASTYRNAIGKAVCPKCEGDGCKVCLQTGFLPRRQLEMLP